MKLVVKSDEEHGKKGPEGKWHDAFLPASFSVKAGQKVTLHIYNYDEGKHSFTSPSLGVNAIVAGGSESKPAETTVEFTAPKAGKYLWWCALPCDPWAMAHIGFMRGYVTVTS
jgi:heme/copper-type cytochrome/quinol oxidase subunit 2